MIVSLKAIQTTKYDLCIVGSGPVGMIVAMEFANQVPDSNVLLVEVGGLSTEKGNNQLDDTISNLNPRNHHDPYECTNKGLGGTSATWGGRCVMYDRGDFLKRDIISNNCTWDEHFYESTQPFVERACEYFECGRGRFDASQIDGYISERVADRFVGGAVVDTVLERWSMPTDFGVRYKGVVEASQNIHLLHRTRLRNVGEFKNENVNNLIAETQEGVRVSIQASRFVLAMGSQEVTRFLLRSEHIFDSIGGTPQSLGHYYQGHINGQIASVTFYGDYRKTDFGFSRDEDGTFVRRRFQFSPETLVEKNLLNTAIWLDNFPYYDATHRSGPLSFVYLMMVMPFLNRFLAPPAIIHSFTKGSRRDIGKHVMNVVRGLPGSILSPLIVFRNRYLSKRKMPGLSLCSRQNRYALRFHAEQQPQYDSKMSLASDGETLEIDYRISDDDVDSVIRCHEELDSYLREIGCGQVDFWYDDESLPDVIRRNTIDGVHQSGTTRIGKGPDQGVVDFDLKVFGTRNLYVCSSSVFPISGQANPTFFTGVCALRLVDHLVSDANNRVS